MNPENCKFDTTEAAQNRFQNPSGTQDLCQSGNVRWNSCLTVKRIVPFVNFNNISARQPDSISRETK